MDNSNSFDQLPNSYSCYFYEDIDFLLKPFKLDDLIDESLKCNPKAQKAVLMKIKIACHEVKEWSLTDRVDKILWFWDQIKDVNAKSNQFGLVWQYSIMSAIKETVMGDCLYRLEAKLPEDSHICYAINKMEEHGLEEKWRNEIQECYQRHGK